MTTASVPEPELLSAVTARRVRGLMAELRMNQDTLAIVLGVSRTAVSDRLRGKKDFDINELPLLAHTFQVSIEYLLGLSELRQTAPPPAPVSATGGGSSVAGMGFFRAEDETNPRRSVPGGGSLIVFPEGGTPSGTRTPNPLIKSHPKLAEVIELAAYRTRSRRRAEGTAA